MIAALKRRLHDGGMKIDRPTNGPLIPMQGLLGYQLRRAWLAMAADLGHRLDDLQLTGMSLSVLLMIEANPGISQSEVATQLEIKRANMTPLAAQFTKRGLIERRATDGRSFGLRLTAAGQTLAKRAWASVGRMKSGSCHASDRGSPPNFARRCSHCAAHPVANQRPDGGLACARRDTKCMRAEQFALTPTRVIEHTGRHGTQD